MIKYQNVDLKGLQKLAAELASSLRGRKAIIGLIGPLGGGKTTFIKAFAKNFGIREAHSPTFVISHEHRIPQGLLYHVDFYRLEKKSQLIPLGLSDMTRGKNILLIEWVDRFPEIKNLCDILITFKVKKGNLRDVSITTNH